MQAALTQRPTFFRHRAFQLALGVLALFILVVLAVRALRPSTLHPLPAISRAVMEQRYGLRVNLIAVTAAGGMVDVRLKLVDAQKARLLLEDKANFPSLRLDDVTLNASEEDRSRGLVFEDGADLFVLYPNAGNTVRPGMQVTLVFDGLALEPIEAR